MGCFLLVTMLTRAPEIERFLLVVVLMVMSDNESRCASSLMASRASLSFMSVSRGLYLGLTMSLL